MNFRDFLSTLMDSFIANILEYTLIIAPFFLIFWLLFKGRFQAIRIQETQRATTQHFKHDLKHTFFTLLIFAVMDVTLFYLQSKGYTYLYNNVDKYGWLYIVISFLVVLFLHDAFFYWTHRAMHHPKLYSFFHKVHHESTDPSPLTSGSFHPSEAIVENALQFILPFVMPLHFGVIIAWQIFDILNNVLAHLGYELYPKGWVKMPILKYKTASTHHNMHHQLFHGNYALYFTWWDKWMGTEFKEYEVRHQQIFERKSTQRSADGFYSLTVAAIDWETADAYTIRFNQAPSVFTDFAAGQHVTLRVRIGKEILLRTFSISSTPNASSTFTITIKRVRGGRVTNYLADYLRSGDTLEVTPPSGKFSLYPDPSHQNHYVMIAGGSGITPIYSMIGTILMSEPKSKITLLYANRSSADIIFHDDLEALVMKYGNRLRIKYFLSDDDQQLRDKAVKGYITRVSLESLVNNDHPNLPSFYLCGPEVMTNQLMADLEYLGVPKNCIHRELFVLNTPPGKDDSLKARITATLFKHTYQFTTEQGNTILQSALVQQIPLPYACQSGICGTCKMKCISGKVILRNNQVLSDPELQAGFILTCQALPQSTTIELQNP